MTQENYLNHNSQYDFSVPTNYLERRMFLDPAGGVTVQRFDQLKYPKIDIFEKIARGYYWVPEEINLQKDRQDMKQASLAIQHMVTLNLLRQTALDSDQGRGPTQVFSPVASLPELEALFSAWGFFETNIHSRSYSHIIRAIYSTSTEVFNQIHHVPEIVKMSANIGRYYDALHVLNCKKVLGIEVDIMEHKKAIWLALHASYALEAIRFMVSFATSLGMMENKLFVGIGNIITLILQDEMLHAEWTAYLIRQVVKDDPDFAKIREETLEEVYGIYELSIQEEKEFSKLLMSKGVVIGLNVPILHSFIDWTANERLKEIDIVYRCETVPRSHPLPWFKRHSEIDSKQAAAQETEATNYVIGAISDDIDLSALPEL